MTHRLREVVLWAGAVLGVLSMVAGAAVMFFGFTFLIFRSGSMGPDIPTGSLALARTVPASELESGDVVSVLAANGARVTHRLVSSTLRGDEASLVLQGDANGTPDEEIYQVTEAEVEIASVPLLGYVVTVLLSPAGLVAAGCLGGMVLLLGLGSDGAGSDRSHRRGGTAVTDGTRNDGRRHPRGAVSAATAVLAVSVLASSGVSETSAFFADAATVRTGTFSSTGLSAPLNVRCVDLAGSQDYINWTAPSGPTPRGYRVFYTWNAGSGSQDVAGLVNYRPPSFASANRVYTITVAALYNNWISSVSTTSDTIQNLNSGSQYRC